MPSAPAVADQESTVGANVNFQLPVGTGGDAPLSYSASNLPAGLSFSGSTRRISGSPTTIQTRTVTYTVTDVDGDADSVMFDFVIGAALALSDMDDTGLQVDFKALIEVSGTQNLYADSDRGGSDTPIDGELGVGDGETNVSRIRWSSGTGRLAFNDDDSPAALDFGAYFNTGGVGADLTFTIQTVDGDWQFTVADDRQGGNSFTVRFDGLPTGLVTALDGITIGDRMIFRAARPAPPTDRNAGVLFRAGTPTLDVGAEAQALTEREAGVIRSSRKPDIVGRGRGAGVDGARRRRIVSGWFSHVKCGS